MTGRSWRRIACALCVSLLLGMTGLAAEQPSAEDIENLQVATRMLEDGLAEEARSLLETYTAEHTEDAHALHLLGLAHFALQEYREALRWFLISQRKDRQDDLQDRNLLAIAQSYELLGALDEALNAYEQYLQMHPEHPDALQSAALIAADLGSYTQSNAYLDRLQATGSGMDEAQIRYHRLLNAAGLEDWPALLRLLERMDPATYEKDQRVQIHQQAIAALIRTDQRRKAYEHTLALLPLLESPERDIRLQQLILAAEFGDDQRVRALLDSFDSADEQRTQVIEYWLATGFERLPREDFKRWRDQSVQTRRLWLEKLVADQQYEKFLRQEPLADWHEAEHWLRQLQLEAAYATNRREQAMQIGTELLPVLADSRERERTLGMLFNLARSLDQPSLPYSRALHELQPRDADARYNYLSDLYFDGQAKAFLDELQKRPYEGPDAHLIGLMRGNLLLEQQQYRAAIAAYEQLSLAALDPAMQLQVSHRTAYALDQLGEYAQAVTAYERVLQLLDGESPADSLEQRVEQLRQYVAATDTGD